MRRPLSPDADDPRHSAGEHDGWYFEAGMLGAAVGLLAVALLGSVSLAHAWRSQRVEPDSVAVAQHHRGR